MKSRPFRPMDQYAVVKRIGRGQSPVSLAIHVPTMQLVAIKVIKKYTDKQAIENASNEIKVLYANRCPLGYKAKRAISNCVKFFDAFIHKSSLKLVLEYMDGGSLCDSIAKHGAIKDAQLQWIAFRITRCLKSLHQRQILHGDIKPGNVLVSKGKVYLSDFSNVYLSDFGTATSVPEYSERKKTIRGKGTTQFMSERSLFGGLPADELCYASDIWSLGLTIYCLAVGTPVPHVDAACAITIYEKLSDRGFHKELQALCKRKKLYDFLSKCLDPDPKARPTASQLLDDPFLLKAQAVSVCRATKAKKREDLRDIVQALKKYYSGKADDVPLGVRAATLGIVGTGIRPQQRPKSTKLRNKFNDAKLLSMSINKQLDSKAPSAVQLPARRASGCFPADTRTAPLGRVSSTIRRKDIPSLDAVEFLASQLNVKSKTVWAALIKEMPWISKE